MEFAQILPRGRKKNKLIKNSNRDLVAGDYLRVVKNDEECKRDTTIVFHPAPTQLADSLYVRPKRKRKFADGSMLPARCRISLFTTLIPHP
jgi:hypothetical protein